MGSLDTDSLCIHIPFEKTIEIWTKGLFKNNVIVYGLKKSEFRDLLSLATKQLYSIFDNIYKKISGVAMGCLLGLSQAWLTMNIFGLPWTKLVR